MITAKKKIDRACVLRDCALMILRQLGKWQDVGPIKVFSCDTGELMISYRTPFQKLPEPNETLKYIAAVYGVDVRKNKPYGLDIWSMKKKVLNIEWDDDGSVQLVSFKPGDWEVTLEEN